MSESQLSRPEPEIIEVPAFVVAGMRYEGKNEQGEIPALWDDTFFPRVGELQGLRLSAEYYGVSRALPGPWTGAFEYLAGVPVGGTERLPEGMVCWEIPAGTFAVLPANNVPDIRPAMGYFYQTWLPAHPEYGEGTGPFIERYPVTFPSDGIIYLYMSITRR